MTSEAEALDLEGELEQIRLHPDQLISGHIVLRLIQAARGSGDVTDAMIDAGEVAWVETWSEMAGRRIRRPLLHVVYRAMIAASPTQNGEGGGS